MVIYSIVLVDLKVRRCSNTTKVHLLRFWEARNVRKGGEFMSLDMLLINKKSTVIQGSVNVNRQFIFRERLKEWSVYRLSGFDVTRSNPNFRMLDAPFSLRFNNKTSLVKKTTFIRPISTELFRFLT
ncbi:unnamed protein product [Eruca vesicaria subsp. sativa]|uniref:Replication protein A 70 kDa DNA-binding subunit B/D first OB fold domain-containing protein n=1 Tax=Eruca vesicaria subsp. sativa TaxID=29727 RepID=A0ABC8K485_ERUVS|nr:unnamed protein product [Eruca vesicaria subsp. sativa]